MCTVHPFMTGKITITAPAKPVSVTITSGAGASANAACVSTNNCFAPNPVTIKTGTTVTWTNSDSAGHTVTSGKPSDSVSGDIFDSGIIKPGKTFQFTFTKAGSQDYFCSVHPWMTGKVTVG
ncbi:hypothetical protein DYY66_2088 [Candidatus Nitrosotalea sp. FS]|nr:plastocyanin/azurin family copper-binding protein [Candidatus Nitrosotalea sp. FS]NHH96840.1 hypothetical protein [Candidatus Nitrosotalea sp. FS]